MFGVVRAYPSSPWHSPSTVVWLHCTRCDSREVITIDGTWTLEEVRRLRRGKDGRLQL